AGTMPQPRQDSPRGGRRKGVPAGRGPRRQRPDPSGRGPRILWAAVQGLAMFGAWMSLRANARPLAGNSIDAMTELLRRIAQRTDAAAFHELYQSYGPRVKAYLRRRGADHSTAEDLAQETLLAVWRRAAL